LKLATSSYTLY